MTVIAGSVVHKQVHIAEQRFEFGDKVVLARSSVIPGTDRSVYVLVHGIGVSHRYLELLHAELAKDADVHSIDLPGFGGLPKPAASPDIAETALLLAGALEALEIQGAILVGQSMGAEWVTELAALRPDLASGVVLIGPVTDDSARNLALQSLRLAKDITGEPLDTNLLVFVDYLRCGVIWYLRHTRFMIPYRIEDRVADLTMPLLIIRGAKDPVAPLDWCRRLRARARNGSLVVIPGRYHNVHHSAPRAVASAIRAFVVRGIVAQGIVGRGSVV